MIYQLQQEAAEVGPHPVRLRSVSVREVNHVQEQALVDVKVLKIKNQIKDWLDLPLTFELVPRNKHEETNKMFDT